jgi:hypothetical protein
VRLVLLDKGVLKVERILLGRHHDVAQIGDVSHEKICAHRVMCAIKIRGYASLEILSLTYINDGPGSVIIHIAAGSIRQDGDFLL